MGFAADDTSSLWWLMICPDTNAVRLVHDLTDADLMVRPVPGANHIAWQLGHMIVSENALTEAGCAMPALPEGFAESSSKETAGLDEPARFHTKAQYLGWLEEQRTATLAALDATPETDFDKPAPESMRGYAPTVGAMFNMIGIHEMRFSSVPDIHGRNL